MIRITDKTQCCGCGACAQACPLKCISLDEDETGFIYPHVTSDLCISCGLCEKACPVLKHRDPQQPLRIVACKNTNEEQRYNSSSGGVFCLIAGIIIKRGGVVFGAMFDSDWNVVHTYAESMEDIIPFQGSKYSQSRIGESYIKVKGFLEKGRDVLFSGTPCQIAGLKSYLRKEYENLLTIEIICHGVPSPKIWQDYLTYLRRTRAVAIGKNSGFSPSNYVPFIESISFRDKREGWAKYGLAVRFSSDHSEASTISSSSINAPSKPNEIYECHKNNLYMQAFISNAILRPICFLCPFKSGKSCADISLGDFWTIDSYAPEINDDKGVTIVYALSERGSAFLDIISAEKKELNNKVNYNSSFYNSAAIKYPVSKFWDNYKKEGIVCIGKISAALRPSLYRRMINFFKSRFIHRWYS